MSIITRGISTVHALIDLLLPFRSISTLRPQKPLRSSSFLALTGSTSGFFNLVYSLQSFLFQPSLQELVVNGLESDHALS